ncbi:unnamed protein product, partial [Ectocarpus sp. 12 AP-2014]
MCSVRMDALRASRTQHASSHSDAPSLYNASISRPNAYRTTLQKKIKADPLLLSSLNCNPNRRLAVREVALRSAQKASTAATSPPPSPPGHTPFPSVACVP